MLGSHRGSVRRSVLTHVLTLDRSPWHAGLLRLQDVVVGSSEGEDGGSGDAEVRRGGECDDGQSTFSVSD